MKNRIIGKIYNSLFYWVLLGIGLCNFVVLFPDTKICKNIS